MFTDLVRSTAWRARIGDVAADARSAELERASREVVTSVGGRVVKSVGDGVMATFDSALAGLDAASALHHVAARLSFSSGIGHLRIGVSSGDMVREGDDWMGAAAIEASRLSAAAEGGAILVADVTERLCRGRSSHELRPVGARVLRGFETAIEVFELIDDVGAEWPMPNALAQLMDGPLVGRDADLEKARALVDSSAGGRAATLVITGEPGVGKTRLAAAVGQQAHARGFVVLYGRCEEGLAAPFQPISEALGSWLATCPDVALPRWWGRARRSWCRCGQRCQRGWPCRPLRQLAIRPTSDGVCSRPSLISCA